MRGRQPRHVADTSLQPLHEQRVVPFQFNCLQGMLHGNVYYRLPGWTGWCSIFFPTVVDRALMALMVYSGEGAQYSARVARFSPDDARCDQFVLQAPTPEGVLARALYH